MSTLNKVIDFNYSSEFSEVKQEENNNLFENGKGFGELYVLVEAKNFDVWSRKRKHDVWCIQWMFPRQLCPISTLLVLSFCPFP